MAALALVLLVLVTALAREPGDRTAQAAIEWPHLVLTATVAGLRQPTAIADPGDGSGRLFVVERGGMIKIWQSGAIAATPFLDLSSRITIGGSEQGLLGLVFPPGYAAKGHFYVFYTRTADRANVVARYRRATAEAADPTSEEVILAIADPYSNHNAGQLAFGPDGFLYVGTGDGGSGGDPENRAQNPDELLGKMLRIDVESGVLPYAIPASNPAIPGGRREIWALGLRNPWRYSFDRATGDLYVADVGQHAREEINFQPASSPGGENYGWRVMEGSLCFNPPTGCASAGLVQPVAEYSHALGCSVTGGYVYRGPTYPRMYGMYFYGDFCTGRLWGLKHDGASWQSRELLDTSHAISTFGEDAAGNLYLVDYSGAIYAVTDPTTVAERCATGTPGAALPIARALRIHLPILARGCPISA